MTAGQSVALIIFVVTYALVISRPVKIAYVSLAAALLVALRILTPARSLPKPSSGTSWASTGAS